MENLIHLIPYKIEEQLDTVKEIPNGVELIQAPQLWEETRGKGITIAVLDTGCDVNHPDLKDRILDVRNFTSDDNGDSENVTDYNGHGTHVAGTIAASENDAGVVGVAPEAKLLILKVLGAKGSGRYEWITEAIKYATEQKVDIISMSLGGPDNQAELYKAIKQAIENNIQVVCAAGNEGDADPKTPELSYPGAYNEVISVGAVSLQHESSEFTNSNRQIDVVAPGEKILSTVPGGKYAKLSGTSMATPHVSGALALVKELSEKEFERKLTESELYAQLIRRTVPLGYAKTLEGNGFVYLTAPQLLSRQISASALGVKI
ncbi:S8 family peptidase [Bacillus tianshenii]|nr:S8 family peptidase [Bacillus tianshenii]